MEGDKSCANGVEKEKDTSVVSVHICKSNIILCLFSIVLLSSRTSEGKTSPEDLVAQGRREAACGKHQEAVLLFEEACSEL